MTNFTHEYKSIQGRKILLVLTEHSLDSVELKICNLSYDDERKFKIKSIGFIIFTWAFYYILFSRHFAVDLILCTFLIISTFQIFQLIKNETITMLSEFAIQTSTEYFFGVKDRLFLPISNIYDVVINEVICDLNVKYILVLRTKGVLYNKKPIIPLLINLEPGVDCLEVIYRNLRRRLYI